MHNGIENLIALLPDRMITRLPLFIGGNIAEQRL